MKEHTMSQNIAAVASTLAADVKAFRSAAVASENKATPFARSALAALVSGLSTIDLTTAAIIHAFGNPKSPKTGKPVAKLSGLRDFTGGDAVRKTAETLFRVFENIDADKPRPVGDEDTVVGAGAIRPLIISFILNEADAPKSLRALSEGVSALVKAFAKEEADASGADNSEAAADNATPEAPAFDVADAIAKLAVFFDNMNEEQAETVGPMVAALMNTYDARVNALIDAGDVAVAA